MDEEQTTTRRWRPRFSLLALLLSVVFVGACGGLWWRWEPWVWSDFRKGGVHDVVWDAVFSPNSRIIATASNDATARLWDVGTATQQTILEGHTASVFTVAFSPDGQQLVTASEDGTVRIWASTGEELAVLNGHTGPVYGAVFSPDGHRVVSASADGTVRIWEAQKGTTLLVIKGGSRYFRRAKYSPDGRKIITASADICIWDATTGSRIAELKAHDSDVLFADFSPDGSHIVTGGWDGTARVWTSEPEYESVAIDHDDCPVVLGASFSPDGKQVATITVEGRIRVCDTESCDRIAMLQGNGAKGQSVCHSPDGKQIIGTYLGTVRIHTRRRPEYWWGIAWLPEFWIALVSGVGLVAMAVRHLRSRRSS